MDTLSLSTYSNTSAHAFKERAGIFQPFSALSGLHEAILAEQQCHSERHSDKVKSQKGKLK